MLCSGNITIIHIFVLFWRAKIVLTEISLEFEQSLFCSNICKQEYLSSEVARVARARVVRARPLNSRDFTAQILSLRDFRAKERLLAV